MESSLGVSRDHLTRIVKKIQSMTNNIQIFSYKEYN
jgi:hypothetical protein